MSGMFRKANISNRKLRLTICGAAGRGKTWTALEIATGICQKIHETTGREARIGVIDTEQGSSEIYADRFQFEVYPLGVHDPRSYVEAIKEAEKYFDVIVIDSLTHAWTGVGGVLSRVDEIAARSNGNSFGAWRFVTPLHNDLVESMIRSTRHIITTMRSKVEYAQEVGVGGKTTVKKLGMAPIQREGMDYEFDVVIDMDEQHRAIVGKTRYSGIDGKIIDRPGAELGVELATWLSSAPPAPVASPTIDPAPVVPEPVAATQEGQETASTPTVSDDVGQFYDLLGLLGVDDHGMRTILAKRGVSAPDQLPLEELVAINRKMRAKLEGQTAVEQIAQQIEGKTPEQAAVAAGADVAEPAVDAPAEEPKLEPEPTSEPTPKPAEGGGAPPVTPPVATLAMPPDGEPDDEDFTIADVPSREPSGKKKSRKTA